MLDPASTRVLVVDDSEPMRQVLVKALQDIGFVFISQAEDGEKGWDAVCMTNPPFQIIFSDWDMPISNGLHFLKRVRSHPTLSKTPFIMITTKSEMNNTLEAVQSGVTNFIVKPVKLEVLKEKLVPLIGKR